MKGIRGVPSNRSLLPGELHRKPCLLFINSCAICIVYLCADYVL